MFKRLLPVVLNVFLAASATGQPLSMGCPNVPVASLDLSVHFFTAVLDFRVTHDADTSAAARLTPGTGPAQQARTARVTLGEECLDLTQYRTPKGRPYPDSRANDRWFQHVAIVVSDIDAAYARLRTAHAVLVSGSPQTLPEWNREAAGISAMYFRDPDGHYLELIHFPKGKGQPKWQTASGNLFLGIDHTAIGIADTQRSLHFYEGQLHFRRTGASENYGSEQEHLSGVFNAHVLITSLRPLSGPGIELLEYLTPATGHPIPAGVRPQDLVCWQTRIEVQSAEDGGAASLSTRWVKLPANADGWTEAAWIEDPDGHLIELVKR